MSGNNSSYPRSLQGREKEWLAWILPADRGGYRVYRELLDTMVVLGEGRRGKGNFVLGFSGDIPDITSPLPPVMAYGVIETNFGSISITVRENVDDQIDVEIVSQRGEEIPEVLEESRRWTYSTWKPGNVCPQCQNRVREIPMYTPTTSEQAQTSSGKIPIPPGLASTASGQVKHFVLAVCASDQRLWVYDGETEVNHLIPVTNFYNELMLHKNIRNPKVALDSKRLFTELASFSDSDLTYAFLTYNKLKTKVEVSGILVTDRKEKETFGQRLKRFFPSRKSL